MRKPLTCSLLLLLLIFSASSLCKAQEASNLSVVSFSWSRYYRELNDEPSWDEPPSPARAPMSDADKKVVERRYGDLMRSKELKKVEREAVVDAKRPGAEYLYKVKVENTSSKAIRILFWEYQVTETAAPENVTHRQFLCAVKIKAEEKKGLTAYSAAPPTNVVSAKSLGKGFQQSFQEKALINRIEYADGSVWQRAEWEPPDLNKYYTANRPRGTGASDCVGLLSR